MPLRDGIWPAGWRNPWSAAMRAPIARHEASLARGERRGRSEEPQATLRRCFFCSSLAAALLGLLGGVSQIKRRRA